jgi:hypothetical protein
MLANEPRGIRSRWRTARTTQAKNGATKKRCDSAPSWLISSRKTSAAATPMSAHRKTDKATCGRERARTAKSVRARAQATSGRKSKKKAVLPSGVDSGSGISSESKGGMRASDESVSVCTGLPGESDAEKSQFVAANATPSPTRTSSPVHRPCAMSR